MITGPMMIWPVGRNGSSLAMMVAAMSAKSMDPIAFATEQQRRAADPASSQLTSANAGSGKTRVLVSRVSRLLMDEVAPEKILCLTYTKAAANEMQTRLFDTLGNWSVMSADDLNKTLNDLRGENRTRDQHELGEARGLFAKALETPEGCLLYTSPSPRD